MLLFNRLQDLIMKDMGYSNTTPVTVQPEIPKSCVWRNHIQIQHLLLFNFLTEPRPLIRCNSNTTPVTVQPEFACYCSPHNIIQIQHLLLFNPVPGSYICPE